jgi:hypothetical protein
MNQSSIFLHWYMHQNQRFFSFWKPSWRVGRRKKKFSPYKGPWRNGKINGFRTTNREFDSFCRDVFFLIFSHHLFYYDFYILNNCLFVCLFVCLFIFYKICTHVFDHTWYCFRRYCTWTIMLKILTIPFTNQWMIISKKKTTT